MLASLGEVGEVDELGDCDCDCEGDRVEVGDGGSIRGSSESVISGEDEVEVGDVSALSYSRSSSCITAESSISSPSDMIRHSFETANG